MEKEKLYEIIKKDAKAMILLYAAMESDGDIYDEPCKIHKRKYNGFHKAIEILSKLQEQGKCTFKAMDIQKEYTMHSIEIKWNLTDDFYLYIDQTNRTEIKQLLDCMDECIIAEDEASSWTLISRIYVPIREIENK